MNKEKLIEKILQLEDKIDQVDSKVDRSQEKILAAIDGIAGRFSIFEAETAAQTSILDRHERDITKIKKTLKLAN